MMSDQDLKYRKSLAKYSASFMSNAKWLSFFRSIIQAGIIIERAEWRFIDSTESMWKPLPSEHDLLPTGFADGKFQPFDFRWIESIYIPASFKPIEGVGYERHQDTEAVIGALAEAGQFQVEVSANGVKLHAYRRQSAA